MKKIFILFLILGVSVAFAGDGSKGKDNVSLRYNLKKYKTFVQKNDIGVTNLTAYPNPFVTKTTISFDTDKTGVVDFEVKNILGKAVYKKSIFAKNGDNTLTFYRNDLKSGMYIYQIKTPTLVISKRFIIK